MLDGLKAYGSKPAVSAGDGFSCGRLLFSITPEDAFDRQPLERGPYRLVADVRLDNRPDLAAALAIGSADASRLSDADLLFEALLKWGGGGAEKLIGEFAFAPAGYEHGKQSGLADAIDFIKQEKYGTLEITNALHRESVFALKPLAGVHHHAN